MTLIILSLIYFSVKFIPEYSWLESYLDNDSFWLEDVLSWDETFELALSDYNIFFFFTSAFFVNTHFFLDSVTKMSFLDVLFFSETDSYNASRELFDFIMWDHLSFISNNFFFSQFLFYTNYQDFITTVLHHSPELTLAFTEFVNSYWLNYVMSYLPSASFDVFSDSFHSSVSEFLDYVMLLGVFAWVVIIFSHSCRIMNWNNPSEIHLVRISSWIASTARYYRQEFDAAFLTFFVFFYYFSMMLVTWDDDQEEVIEGLNDFFTFYFFTLLVFYILKLSVHYLSFLEASISEGRNFSYILTQFLRDMINNFAFILRYLTLIARLNIYDLNDDMLDSYYIFLGDFDDDEYYMETIFSPFSTIFFDTDNNDDRSFFLEDEVDTITDLFSLYFVMLGKFVLFNLFSLEEIARIGLAMFIIYLMVFELNSLNYSYVEDVSLTTKRAYPRPYILKRLVNFFL